METETEKKPDLELKGLEHFTGSEAYYKVLGVNVTDGVKYIMENGYAWFVTDALAVAVIKLRQEPFLTVMLKPKDGEADLIITDGNDHELYRQHYDFTDAKRELKLFLTDNVLMLNSEY